MSDHGSLLEEMSLIDERLISEGDERRHFHGAYLRSTRSVMAAAARGEFVDGGWAERWGLAFAQLYMAAFSAWEAGDSSPGPWRVAFETAKNPDINPLRHSLLGINAHINYDLPQALLAVISEDDFGNDATMAMRHADHAFVDSILVKRVPEEDRRLLAVEEPGDRMIIDHLMKPFNRAGTRRLLKDGRAKVWRNTRILNRARASSAEDYAEQLSALEDLCKQRVLDLVAPRFVLIRLARHGFGVDLPDEAER